MPIRPGNSALSRVVCTLLELVPCSPQLALRVQMHELRMCPMLVLNAYLHPQDPVFDLMCVPTVMHAKKVQPDSRDFVVLSLIPCSDSDLLRHPMYIQIIVFEMYHCLFMILAECLAPF